jgi:conjugal transfer pilus assembly protein TraK
MQLTLLSLFLLAFSVYAEESPPLLDLPFQEAGQAQPPKAADAVKLDAPPDGQPLKDGPVPAPADDEPPMLLPPPKPLPKKRPSTLDKTAPARPPMPSGIKPGTVIKSRQGVTETVEIARGKLNRIVTPYANPKVLTVDAVETRVDGSAVYVATESDIPVSLFISDSETGQAISLQLLPSAVLVPAEIRIEPQAGAPGGVDSGAPMSGGTDKMFGQDSDYVGEVKSVMQALAKQLVPPGFTLEESPAQPNYADLCHDHALSFSYGQSMQGQSSRIVILVAKNTGLVPKQIQEADCANPSVVAVSAWPKVRLNPGEKTEVYILMKNDTEGDHEYRPSLL